MCNKYWHIVNSNAASGQEFQQREVHMVGEIAWKFTPKPSDSGTWYYYMIRFEPQIGNV
jgi:hypothetical protein